MFTTRIPTTFMHLFDEYKLNNPIVCCSGAALYDTNKLSYIKTTPIPYDISVEIDNILSSLGVTPFKNYIINDVLNIYCESIENVGEKLYVDKQKNAPYNNVIMGVNESKSDVLYYLIVEKSDTFNKIVDQLNASSIKNDITIQVVDYINDNDIITNLKYIKIYSSKINDLGILKEYCTDNNFRMVGLTSDPLLNNLLENSDIAVTISNDSDAISKADIVLKKNSYDELFRQISKMYYSKKYQR
jgi:hydroxymethylpyrimidine pyrophosphatase-like HAD family hydrolase